jgi:RNA polymerase sigma factor (sigma-70 family)
VTSLHGKTVGGGAFAPTRWSVIHAAQGFDSTERRSALEELCRIYWRPLYAFARGEGYAPHDAQDLTQGFFERLLEKDYLRSVDRAKGKFRSFLLASFKHFLSNKRVRAGALKRGGTLTFIPLDAAMAETQYNRQLAAQFTGDELFERHWALALLDQVLGRLEKEFASAGKKQLYATLKETLAGPRSTLPYVRLGEMLGMSEAAVKVAVHRLRQRYRELLREEIARTVQSAEEVEEELRHLFRVLSAG